MTVRDRPTWEYRTESVDAGPAGLASLQAHLNEFGSVGWEVVGLVTSNGTVTAVIKRERGVHLQPPEDATTAWHADPLGSYRYRYWDGLRWTEHVSDGDQTSVAFPLGH